jgi:phosphoserine aminotransferase
MALQTLVIDRNTGEMTALQTREREAGAEYVAACVNQTPKGVALNQVDFNEKSTDLDELVDVLKTKVDRVTAAQHGGIVGAQFQALVRDVQILAGRVLNASAVQ